MRLDRRTFFRRSGQFAGLALVAGSAAGLLDACSSASSTSSASAAATPAAANGKTTPASLPAMSFQLSWLENVQFGGSYIAEQRGYYTAAGLSAVDLLPGGPTVSIEPIVVSGKALVGKDSPDRAANARLQGAPLKVIGACYQKSPYAILSLAKTPIDNPKGMIGKKIGIPAGDEPIWSAFLKANGIDAASIPTVPVQSDPSPVASGEVDGWLAFVTNEPIVLETRGIAVHTFLLDDYNYQLVSETYLTTEDALKNNRDQLRAFMTGEVRGWQDQVADPAAGVSLALTKYGTSLNLDSKQQTLEAAAQNTLVADADTKAHGLLTLTPAKMASTVATLQKAGIKTSVAELFDLSLLAEVYDGKTAL
jgi:ABC-type nitrate/sulfonate/bicarbonate transport system substrate-binding protein